MKLWDKGYDLDKDIEQFTIGQDDIHDLKLARYDILGSIAHVRMLAKIGLLQAEESQQLQAGLRHIYQQIERGNFHIEAGVEDVHSQVELQLTRSLGAIGKKIHAGRSRNDQVLVDLRLFFREELSQIARLTEELFGTLQELSEKHKEVLMPGYTHTQVAMVSSFGLWFGAYAEALSDDIQQLLATFRMVNQNPLGSAAGYGSSFPLDRRMTTRLLGFDIPSYNVIYAQMGRGRTELSIGFTLAQYGHTLGKLAADIVLYLSQNFGFIGFPDQLTTGSSIMPHKKNPDVFELIRARCSQLQTLPQRVCSLCGNLTSGYHRDFQLLKELIFPALVELQQILGLLVRTLPQMKIKPAILEQEMYRYTFSVEMVNDLVLRGMSFRDAYREVGKRIADGTFKVPGQVEHQHLGSLGNLANDAVAAKMKSLLQAFPFAHIQRCQAELLKP